MFNVIKGVAELRRDIHYVYRAINDTIAFTHKNIFREGIFSVWKFSRNHAIPKELIFYTEDYKKAILEARPLDYLLQYHEWLFDMSSHVNTLSEKIERNEYIDNNYLYELMGLLEAISHEFHVMSKEIYNFIESDKDSKNKLIPLVKDLEDHKDSLDGYLLKYELFSVLYNNEIVTDNKVICTYKIDTNNYDVKQKNSLATKWDRVFRSFGALVYEYDTPRLISAEKGSWTLFFLLAPFTITAYAVAIKKILEVINLSFDIALKAEKLFGGVKNKRIKSHIKGIIEAAKIDVDEESKNIANTMIEEYGYKDADKEEVKNRLFIALKTVMNFLRGGNTTELLIESPSEEMLNLNHKINDGFERLNESREHLKEIDSGSFYEKLLEEGV